MTAMELQQRRNNFIENYLNEIDNLEMLGKLEKCAKRIMGKKVPLSPIAFSIKEANAEIDLAEKELSEGKGISENEVHQFFEGWRKNLK